MRFITTEAGAFVQLAPQGGLAVGVAKMERVDPENGDTAVVERQHGRAGCGLMLNRHEQPRCGCVTDGNRGRFTPDGRRPG